MKELKGTNAKSLTRASATIIKGESRGKAGQAGDHRHPTPTPSRNNDAQESTLIVSRIITIVGHRAMWKRGGEECSECWGEYMR